MTAYPEKTKYIFFSVLDKNCPAVVGCWAI